MLGWFHKLLPREEKFFELFMQHSEAVVAGAAGGGRGVRLDVPGSSRRV